jgi:sugar/nucleoside kinase (ribokinase family)
LFLQDEARQLCKLQHSTATIFYAVYYWATGVTFVQDEAQQLCKLQQLQPAPHAALCYLLQHCSTAVVTLGSKGCLAGSTDSSITTSRRSSSSRASSSAVSDAVAAAAAAAAAAADVGDGASDVCLAGAVIHQQPGVAGVQVVDVTGAGDMFAAG